MSRYVVGVGLASAATPTELADLVRDVLAEAGIEPHHVAVVATVATRRDHPAVTSLGWPVVAVPSDRLSTDPANPSVAEPAALLAAGSGSVLVVPKRRSAQATAAVARSPVAP